MNFPFDEKELEEWEENMFQQKATQATTEMNQKEKKREEKITALDKDISKLNDELKLLGKISYSTQLGLSNTERFARAGDLQEQIKALNIQKTKLKKGNIRA